jgi:hypothetical protein
VITAAHHATAKLAGYAAAVLAGLILLLLGVTLAVRRRRPAASYPSG